MVTFVLQLNRAEVIACLIDGGIGTQRTYNIHTHTYIHKHNTTNTWKISYRINRGRTTNLFYIKFVVLPLFFCYL